MYVYCPDSVVPEKEGLDRVYHASYRVDCYIAFDFVVYSQKDPQISVADRGFDFWMAFPAALVILSVFPGIATWAAKMLGVQSPVNFIFLAVIFILIVKIFSLSLRISQLDTKIRTLTQEIAIREKLQQEKKEKDTAASA